MKDYFKNLKTPTIILWAIGITILIFSLIANTFPKTWPLPVVLIIIGAVLSLGSKKPKQPLPEPSDCEIYNFKVAGVNFKNNKISRQAILRRIKFQDGEFSNGNIHVSLEEEQFNGSSAIGVYANHQKIGFVPADQVEYIRLRWDDIITIDHINVYGGGKNQEGVEISYGAEVGICFKK